MAKIEIEVNDEILKFVEEQGYEITKFDFCERADNVQALWRHLNGLLEIQTYTAVTRSHVPLLHVRRKPKYRPAIAPMDLGKVCEFSDFEDFRNAGKWLFYGILKNPATGRVIYQGENPDPKHEVRVFQRYYCRILDTESTNGTT